MNLFSQGDKVERVTETAEVNFTFISLALLTKLALRRSYGTGTIMTKYL